MYHAHFEMCTFIFIQFKIFSDFPWDFFFDQELFINDCLIFKLDIFLFFLLLINKLILYDQRTFFVLFQFKIFLIVFMTSDIIYHDECSLFSWKEKVFCSYWVECSHMSIRSSWSMLLFSSIILMIFFLLILSIIERVSVEVSIYNCGLVHFSSKLSFCFMYSEA